MRRPFIQWATWRPLFAENSVLDYMDGAKLEAIGVAMQNLHEIRRIGPQFVYPRTERGAEDTTKPPLGSDPTLLSGRCVRCKGLAVICIELDPRPIRMFLLTGPCRPVAELSTAARNRRASWEKVIRSMIRRRRNRRWAAETTPYVLIRQIDFTEIPWKKPRHIRPSRRFR